MSPKEAKVFIFEDSRNWQDAIQRKLENAGHMVVGKASTKAQGIRSAKTLTKKGVQVATIDGNLNPSDTSGEDGQAILQAIREFAPEVRTAGMSAHRIPGTDVDLGNSDIDKLGKVVTKL